MLRMEAGRKRRLPVDRLQKMRVTAVMNRAMMRVRMKRSRLSSTTE